MRTLMVLAIKLPWALSQRQKQVVCSFQSITRSPCNTLCYGFEYLMWSAYDSGLILTHSFRGLGLYSVGHGVTFLNVLTRRTRGSKRLTLWWAESEIEEETAIPQSSLSTHSWRLKDLSLGPALLSSTKLSIMRTQCSWVPDPYWKTIALELLWQEVWSWTQCLPRSCQWGTPMSKFLTISYSGLLTKNKY